MMRNYCVNYVLNDDANTKGMAFVIADDRFAAGLYVLKGEGIARIKTSYPVTDAEVCAAGLEVAELPVICPRCGSAETDFSAVADEYPNDMRCDDCGFGFDKA